MNEIWKDVEGFEGKYQVSNLGLIRSITHDREVKLKQQNHAKVQGRILKPIISKVGKQYYRSILLHKDEGGYKGYSVAKLVASAFVPNDCNGDVVIHKDGDTLNNNANNLKWEKVSNHFKDLYEQEILIPCYGENSGSAKVTWEDVCFIRKHAYQISAREMGEMFGISMGEVYRIIHYKRWAKPEELCRKRR